MAPRVKCSMYDHEVKGFDRITARGPAQIIDLLHQVLLDVFLRDAFVILQTTGGLAPARVESGL